MSPYGLRSGLDYIALQKTEYVEFSGTFVNYLHKIMCFFFSFRKTVNDEEHDVKDLGNRNIVTGHVGLDFILHHLLLLVLNNNFKIMDL